MTAKLIVKLTGIGRMSSGKVVLDEDGVQTELKRVQEIRLDSEGLFTVTVWTDEFYGTIEVSDATAEVLRQSNRNKALAFLDDKDSFMLREIWAILTGEAGGHHWPDDDPRLAPLKKIRAELDKREEIPF